MFVDESKVAERYNISVRTVRGWRLRGEGPRYRKFGGKTVRYSVADLEAWEAAASRNSTSDPGPKP
jgi:predicted DNA-binding transcriptional regulator AlpA